MTERSLDINDIRAALADATTTTVIANDYLVDDIDGGTVLPPDRLDGPRRMDGAMFVVVTKGDFTIEINMHSYRVHDGSLIVAMPGTLVKFPTDTPPDLEAKMVFTSAPFLSSVNIDTAAIDLRRIINTSSPVVRLEAPDIDTTLRHFDMLGINAERYAESSFAQPIARSVIASLLYTLMMFAFERIGTEGDPDSPDSNETANLPSSRTGEYVRQFLQLLRRHYTRERTVAFYADQLCITPKYLSAITRQATHRSAAEWINNFVALEAKNQLRYSGKTVQEIAYSLNFTSQSSFGKFFKRVTGESPSRYQRHK